MRFTIPTAITGLTFMAFFHLGGVVAEGINCDGSASCYWGSGQEMEDISSVIVEQIDHNRFYNNGEQIACATGWFCAYLQDSGGAPGSSIATLIQELQQHGCVTCGSIPLFYPSDNNVKDGMLTVNYVDDPCKKMSSSAEMC